jgi:hypothetical protein
MHTSNMLERVWRLAQVRDLGKHDVSLVRGVSGQRWFEAAAENLAVVHSIHICVSMHEVRMSLPATPCAPAW